MAELFLSFVRLWPLWMIVVNLCTIGIGIGAIELTGETSVKGLPEPIIATWVKHTDARPDPIYGQPQPRCDHVIESLRGHAVRPNIAVPFPNGVKPRIDPYENKLFLFSGHGANSAVFNDSWLLDVSHEPPSWHRIEYSPLSFPVEARWGSAITFIPNGLVPEDIGLTAIVYGGTTNSDYLDDIFTFNFASNTTRSVIRASADKLNHGGPFARAYVEWQPLPVGFGSNQSVSSEVDSGYLFLMGGSGSSDGKKFTSADRSWDDEWIFSIANRSWTRFGEITCQQNSTTCIDSRPLYSYIEPLQAAFNSSSLNISKRFRPADALPALYQLLANLHTVNMTLAESLGNVSTASSQFQNLAGACTTVCSKPAFLTNANIIYPPENEGYRFVEMRNHLYVFGGYRCSAFGVQQLGGSDCFESSVWILDYSTMRWKEIKKPTEDDVYYPYWPSARAFGIAVGDDDRGIIIFQGGAYQDVAGVWNYYADTYVFHIERQQFVPLSIRGIGPTAAWSASASKVGDAIVFFGGCLGESFSNQLLSLRIDLQVESDNCYAFGPGLQSANSGEQAHFYIQTREAERVMGDVSSHITNGVSSTSRYYPSMNRTIIWSKNQTFGVGLDFSAQLVTTSSTLSDQLGLVLGKVNDLGGGNYHIAYTLTKGRKFKLFVALDQANIPGSPFTVTLEPRSEVDPSQSTASGYGMQLVEKSSVGVVVVQLSDEYGNEIIDERFIREGLTPQEYHRMEAQSEWITTYNSTLKFTAQLGETLRTLQSISIEVINNHNGTFNLTYNVPAQYSTFFLDIRLNNVSIASSPYLVTGLDPVELPDSLVIAFYVLAILVMVLSTIFSILVFRYRAEPAIRSSSPNFLQLLIVGSILSGISVIFLVTLSDDFGCQCFPPFLSVGLVTSTAALLAKSHRVMKIFTAEKLRIQGGLDDFHLFIPTGGVILAMVIINILWATIHPLKSVKLAASTNPEVSFYSSCQGDHIWAWLGTVFAFCAMLLAYGVYLAIKTSNVPEQFNESKLIAASIYNIALCSVIIVPLTIMIGNSSDFLTGRIVLQGIVILWCGTFNVVSVIGPRLFVQLRGWKSDDGKLVTGGGNMMSSSSTAGTTNRTASSPRRPSALPIARASIVSTEGKLSSSTANMSKSIQRQPTVRSHPLPSFVQMKQHGGSMSSLNNSKTGIVRAPDAKLAALVEQLEKSNQPTSNPDDKPTPAIQLESSQSASIQPTLASSFASAPTSSPLSSSASSSSSSISSSRSLDSIKESEPQPSVSHSANPHLPNMSDRGESPVNLRDAPIELTPILQKSESAPLTQLSILPASPSQPSTFSPPISPSLIQLVRRNSLPSSSNSPSPSPSSPTARDRTRALLACTNSAGESATEFVYRLQSRRQALQKSNGNQTKANDDTNIRTANANIVAPISTISAIPSTVNSVDPDSNLRSIGPTPTLSTSTRLTHLETEPSQVQRMPVRIHTKQ